MKDIVIPLFSIVLNRLAMRRQVAALERSISLFISYCERREFLHHVLFRFAEDSRWILRYLSGREIGRYFQRDPAAVGAVWFRLAGDEQLYVREGTAMGIARAAEKDFDRVWTIWEPSFSNSSDAVRQTAAMTLLSFLQDPDLQERILPIVERLRFDPSSKVKAVIENYVNPMIAGEKKCNLNQVTGFETTADLPISDRLIDQVVGQDRAVEIMKLAARQKRSVLLIGEPGTGKSMLGKAMAELLPGSMLEDVVLESGERESHVPRVRILPAGKGEQLIKESEQGVKASLSTFRLVIAFTYAVVLFVSFFYAYTRENPVYLLGGGFTAAFIYWFAKSIKADPSKRSPKCLINNKGKTRAPFIDATGFQAGALLGDVRHDPYQSGGMESMPHQLVEPGAIHLAHRGVLFIDEVSTLSLESQQSLLTAFQEKQLAITGRSPGSSGTMVRTEPVPADFIMVLAGNIPDMENIHPALRSRIRGYGYEVYMNDTIPDTEKNRYKLALFIAQEIHKDGKIPHFSRKAVDEIIRTAKRMAERPGELTSRFRELGGLIRSAGDIAVGLGATQVLGEHVRQAERISQTLEEQMFLRERSHWKLPELRQCPGVIHALTASKGSNAHIVRVWTEVLPYEEVEFRLSETRAKAINLLPVEAAIERYSLPGKYFMEIEGADVPDSLHDVTLSFALSAFAAKNGILIPPDFAVLGSINISGMVEESLSFERKILAAKYGGIRTVMAPLANRTGEYTDEIHIIWVQSLEEAWNSLKEFLSINLSR